MTEHPGETLRAQPLGEALLVTLVAEQLTALRALRHFDNEIRELVGRAGMRPWIMDFRGVTFLVTPALGTLLHTMKTLRSNQQEMILTGLSPRIRQVFELMRLDKVLPIVADVKAAQRRLADLASGSLAAEASG